MHTQDNSIDTEGRHAKDLMLPLSAFAATVAISAIAIFRLTGRGIQSDILWHARIANDLADADQLFFYSLWYPVIWALSLGGQEELHRISSVVALTSLKALGFAVVYWMCRHVRLSQNASAVAGFIGNVASPLPDLVDPQGIYLGQVSPNIWHNSTNIAVSGFSLVAAYLCIRVIRDRSSSRPIAASIALALSVAIKPNFALAFMPVAGVLALVLILKHSAEWKGRLTTAIVVFMPSTLVLAFQYANVFAGSAFRQTTIGIRPLEVWSRFSDNIPLSVLLSFASLLIALLVLRRLKRMSADTGIALIVLCLAVVQYAVLVEIDPLTGNTGTSGNWTWGAHTAAFVAFAMVLRDLLLARARLHSAIQQFLIAFGLIGLLAQGATGVWYAMSVGTRSFGNY